jgi:hypothetical protein
MPTENALYQRIISAWPNIRAERSASMRNSLDRLNLLGHADIAARYGV